MGRKDQDHSQQIMCELEIKVNRGYNEDLYPLGFYVYIIYQMDQIMITSNIRCLICPFGGIGKFCLILSGIQDIYGHF